MADEKEKQDKKPAAKKPAAKKPAEKSKPRAKAAAKPTEAKSGAAKPRARKPAAAKGAAKGEAKKAAPPKAASKPQAEPDAKAEAKPKPARRRPGAKKPAAAAAKAPKTAPAAKREAPRRPLVRARAKYVRSSARKARLVMDHVRGRSVADARALLRHSPRGVAKDVERLLDSAVANAENNHELVGDDLYVKEIYADEGPTLRRFRPRAQGRATRIRKRTAHLTVGLSTKE